MMLPIPNRDKMISTMLYNSNAYLHVRWSYLKACALRMETFCDPSMRLLFSEYLLWLEKIYSKELRSECTGKNGDDFTWEQVSSVYKTDLELWYMFTLSEGLRSKNNTLLKFNPDNGLSQPKCLSNLKPLRRD